MVKRRRWILAVVAVFIMVLSNLQGIRIFAEEPDEQVLPEAELQEEEVLTEQEPDGLVIGWPEWDENDMPYFSEENLNPDMYMDVRSNTPLIVGIRTDGVIEPILSEEFYNFTITYEDGSELENQLFDPYIYWNDADQEEIQMEDIFEVYIGDIGTFILTYTKSNGESYSAEIHTDFPAIGRYSDQTISVETVIDYDDYSPISNTFYLNKYDKETKDDGGRFVRKITIKDYSIDSAMYDGYWTNRVSVEPTDLGYKVVFADNACSDLGIIVKYTVEEAYYWTNEDGEEEVESDSRDEEMYFYFWPVNYDENDYATYLDGCNQQGFSGCYLTEEEFEHPDDWIPVDHNTYYVHADSVQGVIDKLSEAAQGENVAGYVRDMDTGKLIPAKDLDIVNTGYISVQPSRYGNEVLTPQYVASSGNLNGIRFSDSMHPYYVKPGGAYQTVTGFSGEDGDFMELEARDPKVFLDSVGDYLTDGEKAAVNVVKEAGDGLVFWGGNVYRATRNENQYTNRDLGTQTDYYFTLESAECVISNLSQEIEEEYQEAYIDHMNEIGWVFDFGQSETMPGLHVNLYCDMQFNGDMGNLVVGYPDQSLTDGKYYSAVIGSDDEKIVLNGPDSYPEATPVHMSFWSGEGTFNVHTYAIQSELDVEGSMNDTTVVIPEPNALSELTYEQKDAIENGAKMSVKVEANDLDINGEITEESKAAVDAISKSAGSDSELQYLDLTVNASVEGIDGSTNITETNVPMNITFKPKRGYDKKASYRIIRYHNGKVDYINLVDALYGEVAGVNIGFVINDNGTITFLTDRFSTYALEITGGETSTVSTEASTSAAASASDSAVPAESPKTGDLFFDSSAADAPMTIVWIMTAVGMIGMAGMIIYRKKR